MIFNLILLILVFGFTFSFESNDVKVNTSSGLVQGNTVTILNRTINQFLGIPFAEPPVGRLRFAKPLPLKKPSKTIIDATKPKNSCFQPLYILEYMDGNFENMTVSEDCLVLNIWSPQLPENGSHFEAKPVMFFIYGGGFEIGSIYQSIYDGRVLATNDVVVVTANYRLGAFGFLYGGQELVPGNMGLYDQTLALKWVKENVHQFGGNPEMVTIFGESAGSMSVGALVLSPISRNLFKRAILQSGVDFGYKGKGLISKSNSMIATKRMSKSFNCSDDNQWLECLQKVDAKRITDYYKSFLQTPLPIYETEFLPLSVENAFKSGNFNKDIEIMAGVTRDEGTLLAYIYFPIIQKTFNKTDIIDLMKSVTHPSIYTETAPKFYLSNIDPNNETALRLSFSQFYGDLIITCPTYFFAKQFAKNSPKEKVYFYELTYQRNNSKLFGCNTELMGICHGAELEFVFGVPFLKPESSSEVDRNFSKKVMSLWTNFAKTGKPLPDNSTIEWPSFIKTCESQVVSKVIELNPYNLGHVIDKPFHDNCEDFWKQYFL